MSYESSSSEALEPMLPYHFAQQHGIVITPKTRVCNYRADTNIRVLIEVQRRFGDNIKYQAVDEEKFRYHLRTHYSDASQDVPGKVAADMDLATLADTPTDSNDLLNNQVDSPVIRLINNLLLESVRRKASDIHFETREKQCVVRFRIDGVLHDIVELVRGLGPILASRIKVIAQLDIAEKRLPQDGRVTLRIGSSDIDIRVSTIPTQYGERIVLRLLDRDAGGLDLTKIGMNLHDRQVFKQVLRQAHGLVLITGPTGSGKTTTLYSALHYLNDRKRNIMTIEDPIEYSIDGIGQMQVNSRIDLDFACGLRAILRQDPDIIMVGEIRDQETAQMAVRASMTGHFVLSTLHTNSAVASIARLVDMGVERYLLASMIAGVIAQRLVRTLCPQCREAGEANVAESAITRGLIAAGDPVFRPAGCPDCNGEGYRGRTGIYEIVEIGGELQDLIHGGAPHAGLVAAARRAGPGLIDDGAAKIREGLTSIEEVVRVVQG